MTALVAAVLTTVSAPYGRLTAQDLASRIIDPASAERHDAATFAFFSEVPEEQQRQFIAVLCIDPDRVRAVATRFAALAGYPLALGR